MLAIIGLKKPNNISNLDPETVDIVITQNKFKESTSIISFLYYRLIDKETGLLIKKVTFGYYLKTEMGENINLYLSFI